MLFRSSRKDLCEEESGKGREVLSGTKKNRLPNASKDVETQVRQMDCDFPSDPSGSAGEHYCTLLRDREAVRRGFSLISKVKKRGSAVC